MFVEIQIQNQTLLQQDSFISFPHNNNILIEGDRNNKLVSFDPEREVLEETQIQFEESDRFSYVHHGVKMNDTIYLVGDRHLHSLNLITNEI